MCDSDLEIEPIPGKLIVRKVVVNDNGGTKVATDFSFQLNAGAATPFTQDGGNTLAGENIIGFPVGNGQAYSVVEPAVNGYSPAYSNCTGTISNGETKICTITNNDQPGTLVVNKVLTQDNGGTDPVTSFSYKVNGGASVPFEADASNSSTVSAGTYSVVENAATGYTTTYNNCANVEVSLGETETCTITNDDQPGTLVVNKVLTQDNGGTDLVTSFSYKVNGGASVPFEADASNSSTVSAGTYSVVENAATGYTTTYNNCANVEVSLGETETCTITNDDQPGTLVVNKVLTQDNGGTDPVTSFSYKVNGGASVPFEADASNSSTVSAGTYSVVENAATGYTTTYNNCANVEVSLGETETCTITNDDQPGTLVVNKVLTQDNGGTDPVTSFSYKVNGGASVPFEADASNSSTVSAGTYSVVENAATGYTTTYNNCANVEVSLGETETCTITNDDQPGTLSSTRC